MLFIHADSSGETVFSTASPREDFSKEMQNKVLDPHVVTAAKTS